MPSRFLLMLPLLLCLTGCSWGPPPRTVEKVDVARYAGRWYEIARVPQWFEIGCAGVTATYTPRPDGAIEVLNACHEGSPGGKLREARGIARVIDPVSNAKLKVKFQGPFEGDYWIFALNDDYSTAAVGSPDRNTLWILHRSPTMDAEEYQRLLEALKADNHPVHRLEKVAQSP